MFMENWGILRTEAPSLYITSQSDQDVNITIATSPNTDVAFSDSFTLPTGTTQQVVLPAGVRMDGNTLRSRGLRITCTGDVSIYGMNVEKRSTDGFLVFPEDVLTNEYMVTSYDNAEFKLNQIGIVALQDSTSVQITLPSDWSQIMTFVYDGNSYTRGSTVSASMDRWASIRRFDPSIHVLLNLC